MIGNSIEIDPNPLPQFKQLYNLPPGTWLILNVGPRGSGKSYEGSKLVTLKAVTQHKRVAVLRDEASTITQSILHEIKNRYEEINEKLGGFLNRRFEMQNNVLKLREKNKDLIFTKGFSTSSNNKKASLKSLSDVDIAIIEEFEDIADEAKFNSFADSIRNEGSFILINSNIPNKNHWFLKRFFTLEPHKVHDGYFHLIPKNIPGVVYIQSNFRGNTKLNPVTAAKYENYGNPESELYDLNYYLTEIEGLTTEGKKGLIFKGWGRISDEEFAQLPYPSVYVIDFGYSNDPCAVFQFKSHNTTTWGKELIYKRELGNSALCEMLYDLGIRQTDLIIADSAEPKSIAHLRSANGELIGTNCYEKMRGGFNVMMAIKGEDSIRVGISKIKERKIFFTDSSKHIWQDDDANGWKAEYTNYAWDTINVNGVEVPTDRPIDKHNHGIDCTRMYVNASGKYY